MCRLNEHELAAKFENWGAHRAAALAVSQISFDPSFRTLCESNSCGKYGKSYMCPPDVGTIEALIAQAKTFDTAIVYQTVGPLEDSYDIEGMLEAGKIHNQLAQRISAELSSVPFAKTLHLGAGGCRLCETCAKVTGEPCRFPQLAMSSLEAYGINVSVLAETCGMRYIHGPNTVTYFGAFFYCTVSGNGGSDLCRS